jgi:hypothetical protein
MKSLVPVTKYIGNVLKKYDSLKFVYKILLWYISLSIPFLAYHEKHLPIWVIIVLCISSLSISLLTFLLSLNLLKFLFKNEFNPFYEISFFTFGILTSHYFGFLSNEAGILFLFFVVLFFIAFRLLQLRVYYRIILIGVTIFLNGLFSFKFLQYSEIYLFNRNLNSKYQVGAKDFSNWKNEKSSPVYTNEEIPLEFTLPEEFSFHNPKNLELKEKTGTGHMAGIISSSQNDPNRYPLIRIFYIEKFVNLESNVLKEEFDSILEFEKTQGNMEEIRFLGNHTHPTKKWSGNFWTFYDIIRPRYSKIGYYLIPQEDGSTILINIIENLVENKYHEEKIEEILNSIK